MARIWGSVYWGEEKIAEADGGRLERSGRVDILAVSGKDWRGVGDGRFGRRVIGVWPLVSLVLRGRGLPELAHRKLMKVKD